MVGRVIEPRLRYGATLVRGLVYGLLAVPVTGLVALAFRDGSPRQEFLAVVAGLSLVCAACYLPVGSFFWWCSRGDIRRWRDWRTVTGRYGAVAVFAGALVRFAAFALVLGCGSVLLVGLFRAWR